MLNLLSKLVLLVVLLLPCGALAQTGDGFIDNPTPFSRELVGKVKKSGIYIWMFGTGGGPALQSLGIGSGVIFQSLPDENAALALTNHHVAGDTTMMQCELWDHSTYRAELIATEPGIDVALIKLVNISPDAYEPAVLGDSDIVNIGDPGLALGAPGSRESYNTNRSNPSASFGLHATTTFRVVSGKQTDPIEFVETWPYWRADLGNQVMTNTPWRFVVQSAINGGNSGGPLYNRKGEVIGLNHAHFGAGTVLTQNQNYTIPIDYAKNFAYQILNTGKYELPWLGMDLLVPANYQDGQQISEWVERHYDPEKLRIIGVRDNSPAQQAGLQKDDLILEFDGQTFPKIGDLRLYIFSLPIGKQVPITVKRAGRKVFLDASIGPKRSYDSEFSL